MKIALVPHRGNAARSYPAMGYLGMGTVNLAGTVRTILEEDMRPLEASEVIVRVRCYESNSGNNPPSQWGSSASTPLQSPPDSKTSSAASTPDGSHSSSSLNSGSPSSAGILTSSATSSSSSSSRTSRSHSPSNSTSSRSGSSHNGQQQSSRGRVLYEKSITVWSSISDDNSSLQKSQSKRRSSSRYPHVYADLGNFSAPWLLAIPIDAIQQGARSTMIFKNWRIWWAVEAVIMHKPSGIHGDRIVRSYQFSLLNYAGPQSPGVDIIPPLQWTSAIDNSPIAYSITGPASCIGSNDPFSMSIHLKHKHGSEVPKRVSVELRREISYSQSTLGLPTASGSSPVERSSSQSANRRASYLSAVLPSRRVSSPEQCSNLSPVSPQPCVMETDSYFGLSGALEVSRTFQNASASAMANASIASSSKSKKDEAILATFETDVHFQPDSTWNGKITGQMPRAKSMYHYALGETCSTPGANSRFSIVVKLHFRTRGSLIELPHKDITFTTVSIDDRQKAALQLPRIAAMQKAEGLSDPNIWGADVPMTGTDDAEDRDATYVRSIRRRSEQNECLEAPRTRLRLESDPYPHISVSVNASPLISVSSPAMSTGSSKTFRPRSSSRRDVSSTHSAGRNTRPKSSGGISVSSANSAISSQSNSSAHLKAFDTLNIASFSPSVGCGRNSSTHFGSPLLESSQAEGMDTFEASPILPPLASPALFAGLSTFSLCPPRNTIGTVIAIKEVSIPPKPNVRTKTSKTSRVTADIDRPDVQFAYHAPADISVSQGDNSFGSTLSNLNMSSSSSISLSEALKASPPSRSRPSLQRAISMESGILGPVTPSFLGTRRKSSNTTVFAAFFRRGSKA